MSAPRRVKILSDGHATRVVDIATGRELDAVRIAFRHLAGSQPTAEIDVVQTQTEIETGAELRAVCANCSEVLDVNVNEELDKEATDGIGS